MRFCVRHSVSSVKGSNLDSHIVNTGGFASFLTGCFNYSWYWKTRADNECTSVGSVTNFFHGQMWTFWSSQTLFNFISTNNSHTEKCGRVSHLWMASVYWQPHWVLIKNDNAGIPVKKYKSCVLQLSIIYLVLCLLTLLYQCQCRSYVSRWSFSKQIMFLKGGRPEGHKLLELKNWNKITPVNKSFGSL